MGPLAFFLFIKAEKGEEELITYLLIHILKQTA